jgi:hypothetical protein
MTTQLIILPNGTHAKQINPCGTEPIKYSGSSMLKLGIPTSEWNKWMLAELRLKEYRITGFPEMEALQALEEKVGGKISHINFNGKYDPGTVHNFEINQEEGTAIIV